MVTPADSAPYVALDADRPALSDLRYSLTLGLLKLPEYAVSADAVENDAGLRDGIIVDAGGYLHKPERINSTRALLTNFLWRYLREGEQIDWDEPRFVETFNELRAELRRKTVLLHTTLPLSNLKMDIAEVNFGDELKLLPASIHELERWINRDQSLPPLGASLPLWNTRYVDRPAVLHARQIVVGRPPPIDLHAIAEATARVNSDQAITALRLVMNAPVSIIFQEQDTEGFMAFGGGGTSWRNSTAPLGPVAKLDRENATQVNQVWQLLQASPNMGLLRVPLRRWESSLLRASFEDRLIDAWVGLEALLLAGQEGELSYRAAVRLAEFLGTNGVERKAIYDVTKVSYAWRSVIVHALSSKKVAKRLPLEEVVRVTTEHLRSALLKVLKLPGRFDPNKLESDLLSRESGQA